jgi:pimeloyl-ACP methyl ester carboxylesterase
LQTTGNGPDVVLVHGALGDLRQWRPIADVLSRRFRATAVSRRFHWPGSMPSGGATYTFDAQARDVIAVLESFGDPVHLVGHSYGAGLGLLIAANRPDLLRTLTLVEPPFASLVDAAAPEFGPEAESRRAVMASIQASAGTGDFAQAARTFVDWLQGTPDGFARLSRETQDRLLENAPTLGSMYATPQPVVTCEQLQRLPVPALILRGERTRPWFRLIAEAAASGIPGANTGVVPHSAHMCIVENPADTAALVERFIERR